MFASGTNFYVYVYAFYDLIFIRNAIGLCLQCFDAVGWAAGRASGLQKIWSDEVLAWLSVCSEVQMTCIWFG